MSDNFAVPFILGSAAGSQSAQNQQVTMDAYTIQSRICDLKDTKAEVKVCYDHLLAQYRNEHEMGGMVFVFIALLIFIFFLIRDSICILVEWLLNRCKRQ